KLAVATSSDRKKFLSSMAETGLDINLFDAVICGDEVVQTKPSGDIYRYAAAKLCLSYEETIVAEDALNGLSAARDASCSAIGISTSFSPEELLLSGADFVIPSFENFGDFSSVEDFNVLVEKKIQDTVDSTFIGKLVDEASKTMLKAYAPYSKFRVGAAIMTDKGGIYHGCNVENASFGATRCAEQGATLAALASEGPSVRFKALAVATESDEPAPPCAICRQILSEFSNPDLQIYLYSIKTKKLLHYSFSKLLPKVFIL
ncbi:MAG: cytidine deaminase, partial [Sphaerochaetaceae bacterium]|nr:cytidine deaminase [Sphaerochaetaceae bacterium]